MKEKTALKSDESQKFRDAHMDLKNENLTCHSLFDSSLRLTRRMDLIQRALDTLDLLNNFSYSYHCQKVCEKHFRGN